MTYAELTVYGTLRKIQRLGPVGMFRSLLSSGLLNTPSGRLGLRGGLRDTRPPCCISLYFYLDL